MPFCRSHKVTPLARHAALQVEAQVEAAMPFPMYTVSLEDVLEMTFVEPHENLKAKGLLVEFERNLGKAMFISHQWAGKDHPDPAFVQFSVFQDAMKNILSDRIHHIPLDYITEVGVPEAKPLPTQQFRSAKLFLGTTTFHARRWRRLTLPKRSSASTRTSQGVLSSLRFAPSTRTL